MKAPTSVVRRWHYRTRTGQAAIAVVAALLISVWFGRHSIVGHAFATVYGGDYQGQRDVVLQQDLHDCGVAALTMVLSAHGTPFTNADSLRDMVRGRSRGLSLLELQRAARAHGTVLEGYHLTVEELTKSPMPLVAHLFRHFVVVDEVVGGRVMVRDPIAGRIAIPIEKFAAIWSGNVLSKPIATLSDK
jgi:ABC-type bacteriocin/lantibiotic exporter with double-glycine peptidase domain